MHSSSSFYNSVSAYYDNYCEISLINTFLEEEISLIEKYNPQSILEFGIGTGRFAKEYIKRHPDVIYTGIDNSEKMLSYAKDSGAILIHEDAIIYLKKCILENKKIDCIFAPYTAIHHIPKEEQLELFENMKKVSKIIIINCLTKEKEGEIFNKHDETIITFPIANNRTTETIIYRVDTMIRNNTIRKSSGGGREYLLYNY